MIVGDGLSFRWNIQLQITAYRDDLEVFGQMDG